MNQLVSDNEGDHHARASLHHNNNNISSTAFDSTVHSSQMDVDHTTTNPQGTGGDRIRVIWGTNIVISDAISSFRAFLASFVMAQRKREDARAAGPNAPLPNISPNDLEPLYPRLLQQVHAIDVILSVAFY